MIDSLLSILQNIGEYAPLKEIIPLFLIGLFLIGATIYEFIEKKIKIIRKKKMFNLLNKGKDVALSATIRKLLNMKIEKFGHVSKLELDSTLKTMFLEVALRGEVELLEIQVEKYSIEEENNKFYLQIHELKTSREWLNIVILEYLENQKIELPSQHIKLIKAIV